MTFLTIIPNFLIEQVVRLLADEYPLCAQLFSGQAKIYDFTDLRLIDKELGSAASAKDCIVTDFLKAEAVKLGEQYPLYVMLVQEDKRVEDLDEDQEAQLKKELQCAINAKHEKIKDFLTEAIKEILQKKYPLYRALLQNEAEMSKLRAQYPWYVALVRGEAKINDLLSSDSFLKEICCALKSDHKIVSDFFAAQVLQLEDRYPLFVRFVLGDIHIQDFNLGDSLHERLKKECEDAGRNKHDTVKNFLMEKSLQARYPLYGSLVRGEKKINDVLEDVVESLQGHLLEPESLVHEEAMFRAAGRFLKEEIQKLRSLYPLYVMLVLGEKHIENLNEAEETQLMKELEGATSASDRRIQTFLTKQLVAIEEKKRAEGELEREDRRVAAPVAPPSASSSSSSGSSSANNPSSLLNTLTVRFLRPRPTAQQSALVPQSQPAAVLENLEKEVCKPDKPLYRGHDFLRKGKNYKVTSLEKRILAILEEERIAGKKADNNAEALGILQRVWDEVLIQEIRNFNSEADTYAEMMKAVPELKEAIEAAQSNAMRSLEIF